jgi:hypothetical protein
MLLPRTPEIFLQQYRPQPNSCSDKNFATKVADVVGLDLNPPDTASGSAICSAPEIWRVSIASRWVRSSAWIWLFSSTQMTNVF